MAPVPSPAGLSAAWTRMGRRGKGLAALGGGVGVGIPTALLWMIATLQSQQKETLAEVRLLRTEVAGVVASAKLAGEMNASKHTEHDVKLRVVEESTDEIKKVIAMLVACSKNRKKCQVICPREVCVEYY